MDQGWFKLHRCLFEKAIWQSSTPEQKVILITLMGMANHKGKEWEWKGKQFKAEPGQFVTSVESIIKKAGIGISYQNVRSSLQKFKKYEFLTDESTKSGRLITIVNWELYQGYDDEPNKQTNKDPTKGQQRPNKGATTNKNDKNDKNDKNKYSEFVSMKETEYQKLVEQHGESFVKKCIEVLDNYKGSTGKRYKDDYRTILNWVVDRVNKDNPTPNNNRQYD